MGVRPFLTAVWALSLLSACAPVREGPSHLTALSPQQAETEAFVRAIEAGMAHAERVQEMRRSAARRSSPP